MHPLTIVIVNWNGRDFLADCLESLFESTHGALMRVVVVDNASSDGSVEMVRERFPQVEVIANVENVGFAAANNQVLETFDSPYVILLNPDTIVKPGAVRTLLEYMEANPQIGMIGPKLLNEDGSLQRSCWRGFPSLGFVISDSLYLWKLLPGLVRRYELSGDELNQVRKVDHILGACMLTRREIIKQVGPMDAGYFLFLEETDWCYRIRQAGFSIVYVPHIEIVHLGERSVRQHPERTLPHLYRGYCRFGRQRLGYGRGTIALMKLFIALGAVLRLGLWGWRRITGDDQAQASKMLQGYIQVLQGLLSY
jgi:hypothetical protein